MPGRREPVDAAFALIRDAGVDGIVCLNGLDEIRIKSPAYADAIEASRLPCALEMFPIPNLGVPADRDLFSNLAHRIAERLNRGEQVLIHCGLGIGRTGTLACCVLIAMGVPEPDARQRVTAAQAGPETREQDELVSWFARMNAKPAAAG
jgi:protein-tyrosine phosphatase